MRKVREWDIFERIYSGHWFISSYNAARWIHDFPRLGGGNFLTKIIWIMDKGVCKYVMDAREYEASAQFAARRLINNGHWRHWIYKKIDDVTRRYFQAGEHLRKLPFSELSDSQLIKEMNAIIPLQRDHQVLSTLVNGVIIDGRNHLSNIIRSELRNIINDPTHFEAYWSLLTLPTRMSLRQRKDYEMSKLSKAMHNKGSQYIANRLKCLHQKYCWLDYLYMGPPASLGQFAQELEAIKRGSMTVTTPQQLIRLKQQQRTLMKHLHLNQRGRFLVQLAQYVIWQKGYRKDMMYHGFYCYEPFIKEVARRQRIDNFKLLFFLFPWEVEGFIRRGRPDIRELEQRKIFSCFVVDKQKSQLKTGRDARIFIKKLGLKEHYLQINKAQGQCAYAGKAVGTVKIIHVPTDMAKMNKGDILISQATSPDLLPAMKKASAIVTNTGGLICHAAITARELKIPCVVGTKIATQVFKDGDRVEVDANKGIIRKR